jgi:hypothetical protein
MEVSPMQSKVPPPEVSVNPPDPNAFCLDGLPFQSDKKALVNLTKSTAAFRVFPDLKTGELHTFSLSADRGESHQQYKLELDRDLTRRQLRIDRFRTQRTAAEYLSRDTERDWRVTGCTWWRIDSEVTIKKSIEYKTAHYSGLMICGSVWTCPVCAAKISERRRQELEQAFQLHEERGGSAYMITLTFRHSREDNLKDLIKRLRDTLMRFRGTRRYKVLKANMSHQGLIRALEITHGQANGWHPHLHELWFTSKKLSAHQIEACKKELFDLWHRACKKSGLGLPNRKYGVDLVRATSPQDYITKSNWGSSHELTKGHIKTGKTSSTPFDLLRRAADGDKHAGSLFVEYAKAFHGARQLFWSHGLKSSFGLLDQSDEDLAEEEREKAETVYTFDGYTWRLVRSQKYDYRGFLLSVAESGGTTAVHNCILRFASENENQKKILLE